MGSKSTLLLLCVLIASTTTTQAFVCFRPSAARLVTSSTTRSIFQISLSFNGSSSGRPEVDDEIERLRAQAAKLRAEAAELEALKYKDMAAAAQSAFSMFDKDGDGQVSLQELKEGLERLWKTELSDSRAKELMDAFDASGDGSLQMEEFVTLDRLRNKLDALVREEKEVARVTKKKAEEEAVAALFAQAKLEFINDRPPTGTDKILSIIPYLLPLMDGLQYGRFLLTGDGASSNPLIGLIAILYTFYRSVPFSGFVAFFALNILSGNPKINRLIRFNMQQAIYVDFALFFPGILLGASQLVSQITGGERDTLLAPSLVEAGYDVVFFSLLAVLAYTTISSLLGITPDKLPIISKAANDRMPTVDQFDDKGGFIGKPPQQDDDDKDEGGNKKK